MQIETLVQQGLFLDSDQPLLFFWVVGFLLLLDRAHVYLAKVLVGGEILVQSIRRVDWLKLLGGIFAGIFEDNFLTTRMFC